jgi:hypothetical protein
MATVQWTWEGKTGENEIDGTAKIPLSDGSMYVQHFATYAEAARVYEAIEIERKTYMKSGRNEVFRAIYKIEDDLWKTGKLP